MRKRALIQWLFSMLRDQRGEIGADINAGSTETSTADAGTVTGEAAVPEPQAGAIEAEAGQPAQGDTTSQEAPAEGTEGQEPGTEGEASPGEESKHKGSGDRIQELLSKVKEYDQKTVALEEKLAKIEGRQVQQQPDFVNLDFDAINAHVGDALAEIDRLKMEGRALEALELQDELNELRQNVKENERKKSAFMERQKALTTEKHQVEQLNQSLETAAKLVQKEFNIPENVMEEGRKFFTIARQQHPLVDAQYREIALLRGPVAAMLFARDYIQQEMGKVQQQALKHKETAKQTLPPGKTGTQTDATQKSLNTIRAKAEKSGDDQDWADYFAAKREARS